MTTGASAIPFRKASTRKRTLLSTFNVPAGLGGRNDWELNSKGFLAKIKPLVSGTETTATGDPVAAADWPYNIVNRWELRDSAGGMIQSLKGYSAFLADRYFAPIIGRNQSGSGDTRIYQAAINLVQANTLAWSYTLNIAAGTKDLLGALPNQNASFKYTLTATMETLANVVTTVANWSTSAITIQPSMHYFTVPAPMRSDGAQQQHVPPFPGVIRQVYDQSLTVAQAAETPYNLVTGHVKRGICIVFRATAAGARQGALTRLKLMYGDDNVLFDATQQDIIDEAYRIYGEVPPLGVYPIPFTSDNDTVVGADFRRDLLDTRRLSNLYLLATFSQTGAMDIIHDDLLVPLSMSV